VLAHVLQIPLDHHLPHFPLGIPFRHHWIDVSGDLTEQFPSPLPCILLADDRAFADRYLDHHVSGFDT
jgi:hypothetical protein